MATARKGDASASFTPAIARIQPAVFGGLNPRRARFHVICASKGSACCPEPAAGTMARWLLVHSGLNAAIADCSPKKPSRSAHSAEYGDGWGACVIRLLACGTRCQTVGRATRKRTMRRPGARGSGLSGDTARVRKLGNYAWCPKWPAHRSSKKLCGVRDMIYPLAQLNSGETRIMAVQSRHVWLTCLRRPAALSKWRIPNCL